MIEKINGRWTVTYGKLHSVVESESEAKSKLKAWKGEETIIFEDDDEDDGQPDEAQEWYDFDPDA